MTASDVFIFLSQKSRMSKRESERNKLSELNLRENDDYSDISQTMLMGIKGE